MNAIDVHPNSNLPDFLPFRPIVRSLDYEIASLYSKFIDYLVLFQSFFEFFYTLMNTLTLTILL